MSSSSVSSAGIPFSASILRIDGSCVLHPFTLHKLDAGPIRLMTIAHAFNYRMAVLHDGVKSAARVGRSRKAEGRFLTDTDLSWGQQVAVMFRIISTLMPPSDGGGGRWLVPLGLMSGRAYNPVWRRDVQDRCLLFLIGPELMAVFSWRCMCGGGLGCWCLLIGSGR